MSTPREETDRTGVPPLADLLKRYLERQTAAQRAGLGRTDAGGEVTPYDAIPAQSIDPRLAWHEAVAVAPFYEPVPGSAAFSLPPDWPALVASQEPAAAVAFCFANFPQLVRNLQALLHATDLGKLGRGNPQPAAVPGSVAWAELAAQNEKLPQSLLAAGVLRLARQFDSAEQALQRLQTVAPASWQAALANEQAALAWSQGQWEDADRLWQAQPPTVPVLFNRGMSALFLGRRDEARRWLGQAVQPLADTDGWHHLGRLYLALAG